jgi:acyl-coenzyme A thioesterase PaaI-like protein
MPRLSLPELEAVLDAHTPRWRSQARILALDEHTVQVAPQADEAFSLARGPLSGPALMALADRAAYYLTIAVAGPVPSAVTSHLTIHFLVRPEPVDLTATATLLRLGRRLATSSVDVQARTQLVAHATVTYALPH